MKQTIPDFDEALQGHLRAITERDIEAFKARLTRDAKLYTIVQNGQAFTTPQELIDLHIPWFKDSQWIWEGKVVHKVVGTDMAMALIRYEYRSKAEDKPMATYLVYVFRSEDGQWRIVHDQNTLIQT